MQVALAWMKYFKFMQRNICVEEYLQDTLLYRLGYYYNADYLKHTIGYFFDSVLPKVYSKDMIRYAKAIGINRKNNIVEFNFMSLLKDD